MPRAIPGSRWIASNAAPADPSWLNSWREADSAVASATGEEFGEELSEPLVAARLGEWLGADTTSFRAASMPIRDLECYLPARRPLPRVLSNRGANGIDGTVSSAFGVAAAGEGPVVLLIGDVALAHDIGGLLAAKRLGLEITIVLLNNDGGGIFHFLPISGAGSPFAWDIATPHGLEFEHAAALYELRYHRPRSPAEARSAEPLGRLRSDDDHRDSHGARDEPRVASPARVRRGWRDPELSTGGTGEAQPESSGSIT